MSKRDKIQLSVIYGAIAFILAFAYIGLRVYENTPAHAEAQSGYNYTCPDGQYPIGDGVCKNQPTGCPFGDSIPVDSPKCAPPSDIECNADWTECHPKSTTTTPPTDSTPVTPTQPKNTCGK